MHNKKYLKAKIKSYNGKIHKKNTKGRFSFYFYFIDSVFRKGNCYYHHQVFLKECKHVVKEKKMPEYITDDSGKILMKKILMKKFLTKKIKYSMECVYFYI